MSYLKQARLLAGALALVVGLTLVAPPAFAAGPAPGPITTAATAKVESMPAAAVAQAAAQTKPAAAPAEASKPFFKTGKGAAAAVLIVGVLAMTFVSYSSDRVKSPRNAVQ